MTAGDLTPARRVGSIDELERAGDYYGPTVELGADDRPNGKRGVWFLLPLHQGNKYARDSIGSGLHRVSEPPWRFRECGDGSLEIRESIACGNHDPEGLYWHGYLDEGNVWREV